MSNPDNRDSNAQTLGVERYFLPLITLTLFIAAMSAVSHMLDNTSVSEILSELTQLSYGNISLALLCVIASYWVLSGYDWMALRYIGRSLPYSTVTLATFCSCAIAYSVGANLISGGSVRLRIYLAAGLSALDVVHITLFGMVAFTAGTSVVAAMALTIDPVVIADFSGISATILRNTGLSTLALCAIFLIVTGIKKTPVRVGRWGLRLPSIQITCSQLIVSLVDMVFAGGCLYILIGDPNLPFIAFLIVFSLSFVAGLVSHVPGGIGVFDGIILFAFHDSVAPEALAAALVVYRIIYYLIPLVLATAIMAMREVTEYSNNGRSKSQN